MHKQAQQEGLAATHSYREALLPDLGQTLLYHSKASSHPPHPSSGAPGQLKWPSASAPSLPPIRYRGAGPQVSCTPEPIR